MTYFVWILNLKPATLLVIRPLRRATCLSMELPLSYKNYLQNDSRRGPCPTIHQQAALSKACTHYPQRFLIEFEVNGTRLKFKIMFLWKETINSLCLSANGQIILHREDAKLLVAKMTKS